MAATTPVSGYVIVPHPSDVDAVGSREVEVEVDELPEQYSKPGTPPITGGPTVPS
ncbi:MULTISPECIES: hypothetical protein [Rhodococcus]|jgi:hypothetical protein|uniref:Uncharacterized protein n=1 Tax=Rhodococcus qingshengii TaxID=334542 RepID=A0AAW6LN93_RHOSG|nr:MULTISPECIES: hypothetical protein [Rhodococcus]MBS3691769.1 hypothetical protein [Rhodococcus qingshengii]MDE8648648.1 hypothetical protein [Rhodococcus qingshengii]NDK71465.1 hypothetical protein [Rhodococcus qingshengii]